MDFICEHFAYNHVIANTMDGGMLHCAMDNAEDSIHLKDGSNMRIVSHTRGQLLLLLLPLTFCSTGKSCVRLLGDDDADIAAVAVLTCHNSLGL